MDRATREDIEFIEKGIIAFKQRVNNLCCCGNCKKLITYDDSGDVIDECDRMESPSYLCIDWEYDGLTAEDRKI